MNEFTTIIAVFRWYIVVILQYSLFMFVVRVCVCVSAMYICRVCIWTTGPYRRPKYLPSFYIHISYVWLWNMYNLYMNIMYMRPYRQRDMTICGYVYLHSNGVVNSSSLFVKGRGGGAMGMRNYFGCHWMRWEHVDARNFYGRRYIEMEQRNTTLNDTNWIWLHSFRRCDDGMEKLYHIACFNLATWMFVCAKLKYPIFLL